MRIACLQFAPQVGDVNNNLNRADAVLSKANPKDLDLLVLPELAFSGYNFQSLQHISPYLEPTAAGITSLWARTTALKYDCVVTAGYPEKVDITPKWPASPEYYNSSITVNADGETVAHYRKSFLYYTDETWALEGDGFYDGHIDGLGNVALGICMDLNPYKFQAHWNDWEFSYHILHKESNLVILSMAWLTREDARSYSRQPKEPDMDTLSYWLSRLEPLIRAETEGEIIVVIANRCGTEGDAVYAGTSAILGIQAGEVKVYGILGRGDKELLVVDTSKRPQAKLVSEVSTMVPSPAKKRPEQQLPISRDSQPKPTPPIRVPTPKPATDLRIDVKDTPGKKPSTLSPNQKDLEKEDVIITPLSPINPSFHSHFFSQSGHQNISNAHRESLLSTVYIDTQIAPKADSPTIGRPDSTTPRSESRTSHRDNKEQNLVGFAAKVASREVAKRSESPAPPQPQSTEYRTTSRTGHRNDRDSELARPNVTEQLLSFPEPPVFAPNPTAQLDSVVSFRPPSTKSRNVSRTGHRNDYDSDPVVSNFIDELSSSLEDVSISYNPLERFTSNTHGRSSSRKSRSVTRGDYRKSPQSAIVANELAKQLWGLPSPPTRNQEEFLKPDTYIRPLSKKRKPGRSGHRRKASSADQSDRSSRDQDIPSGPQSASAVLDQLSCIPRQIIAASLPRPKSTHW